MPTRAQQEQAIKYVRTARQGGASVERVARELVKLNETDPELFDLTMAHLTLNRTTLLDPESVDIKSSDKSKSES
jgi:hypothetical protein